MPKNAKAFFRLWPSGAVLAVGRPLRCGLIQWTNDAGTRTYQQGAFLRPFCALVVTKGWRLQGRVPATLNVIVSLKSNDKSKTSGLRPRPAPSFPPGQQKEAKVP